MREQTLSERVETLEKIISHQTGGVGFATYPDANAEPDYRQAAQQEKAYARSILDEKAWNQAESPTALHEIMQRIGDSTMRIRQQAEKIEDIGNRIMGTIPCNDGTSGAQDCHVQPDGTLDHTFLALNWLDAALRRLESATIRLERI